MNGYKTNFDVIKEHLTPDALAWLLEGECRCCVKEENISCDGDCYHGVLLWLNSKYTGKRG